jgi:general secretion pathway protein F
MQFRANVVQGRASPRTIAVEASSKDEARAVLRSQGYTVLSIASGGWLPSLPLVGDTQGVDVDLFVEQLRDLLQAGLSLVEALSTLHRTADQTVQWLAPVLERLRSGQRFSEALLAGPGFPPLLIALVKSSELTSDLGHALDRFLDHRRKSAEVRDRLISVAIYPLLLTGVGMAVLLFLLLYVVPKFARIFEGMTGSLPWSARVMVWWSQWLAGYGTAFYLAVAALLAAFAAVLLTPALRAKALAMLLDSGLLRDRLRTYFLARWYRGTGTLIDGGIPLVEALVLSRGLLPSAMHANADAVREAVRGGLSPSAAHASGHMLTPVAEQLMLAGERTGDLGTVLVRIAQFHEAEVSRSLERLMKILEPAVMVFIGVGVGVVVVLMYLPIFELASAIQ